VAGGRPPLLRGARCGVDSDRYNLAVRLLRTGREGPAAMAPSWGPSPTAALPRI